MSGETSYTNVASYHHHQQNVGSVAQIDYMKLLNILFQHDVNTPSKHVDVIFEQFEKTFQSKDKDKQQINLITNIIGQLFDYYMVNGVSNSVSLVDGKSKTIVDLFCLLPEDFCTKFFDKISDFIRQIPQSNIQQPHSLLSTYTSISNPLINSSNLVSTQNVSANSALGSNSSSQSSSANSSNNSVKQFEKCTNLMVLVCYRKKNWLNKLLNHSLLTNLIRMLKVHTNLNDLILVHVSLLFVLLMNKIPAQILNAHLENIFLIFTYLYKYLISVDNQKLVSDEGTIGRNVKWAVRLYFYVCYGLYANQFVQFLRKKDHQSLNKEFLTSIFFYLRLHPALFKEKIDSDKQLRYLTDADASIEWRQYCLDPLCTNYNQTIQKIFKHGSMINLSDVCLNPTVTYNIANNVTNQTSEFFPLMPPTLASLSKLTHESQNISSLNQTNIQMSASIDQTALSNLIPLSPSYLFANTNRNTNLENPSIKMTANSNISLFQQPSLPTTPHTQFTSASHLINQNVFQYPPLASEYSTPTQTKFDFNAKKPNQLHQMLEGNQIINKQHIRNLTPHFMMNETSNNDLLNSSLSSDYTGLFNGRKTSYSIKKSFFFKQKSKSETNLYFDLSSEKKAHTFVSKSIPAQKFKETQNQGSTIIMPENDANDFNDENYFNYNKISTKSETRDSNVKDPMILSKLSSRNVNSISHPNTTDSSTNTYENDSCSLSQTSINLLSSQFSKLNSIEANDPLYGYFANLNQSETSSDNASTIKKLRQEVNHLVLQLIYERHLRDKYEEDSNRLHFYKIERDQLLVEKSYLEKNLKQLVEEYKNEIEKCLSEQNKVELNAFKKEIDDKDFIISELHSKLTDYEEQILDWSQKYQNIRVQNEKIKLTYGTAIQSFESELNSRTKNEIDANYLKSLRYSNDTLRKKLLLLSKSQQTLLNTFNQSTMSQLKDVIEIYNNPLLLAQFLNAKKDQDQLENVNATRVTKSNSSGSISSILLSPLLEFQQETIQKLQNEIDSYKSSYDKLLIQRNEMGIKLEQLNKKLELEVTKSNELDQSLDMEVVNKAELIKNHVRIESSLINVNKRLEEEIVKLKANLKEQVLTNSKLQKQNESLKSNKYESIRMFLTQSNLTEQSESRTIENGDHANQ